MGLFDRILCHHPLPFPPEMADPDLREQLQCAEYQTKDLSRGMGNFKLRTDGTLWEWVRAPEDEEAVFGLPHWALASTVLGHIHFYDSIGRYRSGWVEWRMSILDGRLIRPLELVSYRPVDPEKEAEEKVRTDRFFAALREDRHEAEQNPAFNPEDLP